MKTWFLSQCAKLKFFNFKVADTRMQSFEIRCPGRCLLECLFNCAEYWYTGAIRSMFACRSLIYHWSAHYMYLHFRFKTFTSYLFKANYLLLSWYRPFRNQVACVLTFIWLSVHAIDLFIPNLEKYWLVKFFFIFIFYFTSSEFYE